MLNSLRIQNFKSWQDTGTIQFGAITGFFGTNSSGKTSILQFLLMLKQTVESSDRAQVLNLGDERSYVELGTFHDIIYQHSSVECLQFMLTYDLPFTTSGKYIFENHPDIEIEEIGFSAKIAYINDIITLDEFKYFSQNASIGIKSTLYKSHQDYSYELVKNDRPNPSVNKIGPPIKFYNFPRNILSKHINHPWRDELAGFFENTFTNTYYLGPLREYPSRLYVWGGEKPGHIGNRGAGAVAAILASKRVKPTIGEDSIGYGIYTLEQHVAYWLKELGLIHSFEVRPIAPNRKEYEVRIKRTAESAEVFLTDVGFGVSQLLPVLVLLFYVPEGSTIILEQPEIHLHPAVQAGLADVFIDAIKRRNVQIILESHSEHLLQRLQRRLAEEALPTEQVKLYFTDFVGEASTLTPLDLDEYGNIRNWPPNFFGDSFADASAMMDAEIKRRQAKGEI
jgi:AAA15 family ATPase/GTPase